ncbi:klaroid protein-like isoform X2 [Prorops nasuta]|uniref:klaroid protein-like isoform X2 n=1 Tax=Prorops nasuta TaxID=863751 RepID=UPI0034CDC54E
MDNEQHHYELRNRSRSRSQTPMVLSQAFLDPEAVEHHYDLRHRSRERSHTPGEVTSSRRSGSRSLPGSTLKSKEKNKAIIEEKTEEAIAELDTHSRKSDSSSSSTRRVERRSERQKAKRQTFVNGQSEIRDNTLNEQSEQRTKLGKKQNLLVSDCLMNNGDKNQVSSTDPASVVEFYRKAGEWWNVFPKTDYTYSPVSQSRYEVAPGILAMPNMSRPSIHSNCSSITDEETSTSYQNLSQSVVGDIVDIGNDKSHYEMCTALGDSLPNLKMYSSDSKSLIFKSKHVENYCSQRKITYTHIRKSSTALSDSDTELDGAISVNATNYNGKWKITQLLSNITKTTMTWCCNFPKFIKFQNGNNNISSSNYAYYQNKESKLSKIWKFIHRWFHYIYLLLVYIMLLDSWALSQLSRLRSETKSKWVKLFWIILLPLFLLTGYIGMMYIPSLLSMQRNIGESSSRSDILFNYYESNVEDNSNKNDNIWAAINALQVRMEKLEASNGNTNAYLSEYAQTLRELQNTRNDVSKFQDEHLLAIEKQIESFKSCCNSKAEHLLIEQMEERMNSILTGYLRSTVSKEELHEIINVYEENIRKIIREMIKIYDADKTGLVDYALESAGGQIISTRCTQKYDAKSKAIQILGFTLSHEGVNPRTVIQGNPIQPGVCWAFQNFPGHLLIKLRTFVMITGFTLEHASKLILPNREMGSAPKKFNVWAFSSENDPNPVLLGDYEFQDSDESLQYFPVQNAQITSPYEYVELRIHSNHGQLEYTCLYRFRVHGQPK